MILICQNKTLRLVILASVLACWLHDSSGQMKPVTPTANADDYANLRKDFLHPPKSAHPWVFWYWMYASVTKEGITADLEAMKDAGIGGAYLMPIKDAVDSISIDRPARQLSPEWWGLVRHALSEAERLQLEIGMHISDGFALAGGPWITPELSMQKVVWSDTIIEGNQLFNSRLPEPVKNENYYRDIAVYAYPAALISTPRTIIPKVSTSTGADASFLVKQGNRQTFSSSNPCWIQYEFDRPFKCRHMVIRTNGNNFQAHRMIIEVSDDGSNFRSIGRLRPPRHGWQDGDADVTHVIEPVEARFFRFVYDKSGSEPGSEDLDAAKWSPTLRVRAIELSGEARIHHYEGKNGSVWRVSDRTDVAQLPDEDCIRKDHLIKLTSFIGADGRLQWNAPPGHWKILRMGHTSTGHTNATGGGGKGLECDKFNPAAIRLQFDRWFGEAMRVAGPQLTRNVLKVMHVDSWECGSQNWSPLFREEFRNRRGYDPVEYLPLMAGVPIISAAFSEQYLYDIRQTITELVVDRFYSVLKEEAAKRNISFSAESVAPTMLSDGLLHYDKVDLPMGEFWLRSPTHDKPNDMHDAISGAHIYGKKIVQAESFTELRMAWDEHPGMLKTLGDRNYALGINKLVYHVFVHNPWFNRKPGMTLDGIGLYFQRDQVWWKKSSAWIQYAKRTQAVLQSGKPVTDVAVFTGEELPRRSVLPDRLVSSLPGIFGDAVVESEKIRLANINHPLRELPAGVRHSANMADPENWIDPLRGYAYDSFNPDALLRLATVKNGKIELPGGASYSLLVVPGQHRMSPENIMSAKVANRLQSLVKAGAKVIMAGRPRLMEQPNTLARTNFFDSLWLARKDSVTNSVSRYGMGHVSTGPYNLASFDTVGLHRDFVATGADKQPATGIAWTHRKGADYDVYFVSNQDGQPKNVTASLRVSGRVPEIWDAVNGEILEAQQWNINPVTQRTEIVLQLEKNASCFIVLHRRAENAFHVGTKLVETTFLSGSLLNSDWKVDFKSQYGDIIRSREFPGLEDWTTIGDTAIKYFSGTAVYAKEINVTSEVSGNYRYFLDLGKVSNIAEVWVNGISCGIMWTHPFRADITKAIRKGRNRLLIEVTNTWANRLIGDQLFPVNKRYTRTIAPFRQLQGRPLLEAGLLGPLQIVRVR